MGNAKEIILKPIDRRDADTLIKRVHYSGKTVNNSQLHIGVFYNGKLEGAMQFGPSLDKRKIQGLVGGTKWHEFIELNRMAFTDELPRNSESRALSIAMKLIRKHAPQIKWVITFADATQCGDGTIYRASGFILTGIKQNDQIWRAPDGEYQSPQDELLPRRPARDRLLNKIETGAVFSRTSLTDNRSHKQQQKALSFSRGNATKGKHIRGAVDNSATIRPGIGSIESAKVTGGGSTMRPFIEAGFKPLEGFQLRYIYFIDNGYRERLTVPELPFSKIHELNAGMYRGEKRTHANEAT